MTNVHSRIVLFAFLVLMACKPTAGVAFTELPYPVETKTVKVGNAEIAYADLGQGERTLVLIHGLGSYLPVWKRNVDVLARNHRVIAIDLPGYGKSAKLNFPYSMEFFAEAVRGVVRELDLKRVTLVGHSMGGQIAMTYALMYPGDVEALVLASPAGLETFNDGEAKWLANAVTPEFTCTASPESIYARHITNFYKMPKDADFMVDDRVKVIGGPDFDAYCRAVSRSVAGMLDAPVHERLPEITVPVLVLFGKHDALIPNPFLHGGSTVKMAQKAVTRFPDGELVVLDRAGHMAQFEQPDRWNEAVLEFLRRDPGAPKVGAPVNPGDADGVVPLYAPGDDPEAEKPQPAVAPEPAPAADAPEPAPSAETPPPVDPAQPSASPEPEAMPDAEIVEP
jgi:pimeloyl-ACP methyl ester carboxylesterase